MKKGIAIFLISLIVLALGVSGYFIIKNQTLQSVTYSSVITSIDDAYVTGEGEKIVIQATLSSVANQNVKIDFDKDEINSIIKSEGYEVTDISTLYISMNEFSRDFYAGSQREVVYKYGAEKISVLKNCENNLPNDDCEYLNTILNILPTQKFCIYQIPVGSIATFSNEEQDNIEVKFKIDSDEIGTITSTSKKSITSSDGSVKIVWTGNLLNFNQLTTPNSYALYNSGSKFTKMIYYSGLTGIQVLKSDMENGLAEVFGALTESVIESEINEYNNQVTSYIADKTSKYESDTNSEVTFTDKGINVDGEYSNVLPTFTITLDAEYVAIEKLSGDPDITDCMDDGTISSTGSYTSKFTVKNIASTSGSFSYTISCTGDSQISDVSGDIGLVNSKDSETISAKLTGINSDSGTQKNKCTLTVYDAESDNKDTCTFYLNVKYVDSIICDPDSTTCYDSDTLQTCSSDGGSYDLTDCSNGCKVLTDGSAQCITTSCEDDSDCDEGYYCSNGVCTEEDLQCKFYQTEKPAKSTTFLGIFKIEREAKCVTATWVWLASILVILVLAVIILWMLKKKPKR